MREAAATAARSTMTIAVAGDVLVLSGDLDVRSTGAVRSAIQEHLWSVAEGTGGPAVIDVTEVTSVDETALKLLAAASRRARRRGHRIVLRGACPAVLRMLHLTRMIRLIEVERDILAV